MRAAVQLALSFTKCLTGCGSLIYPSRFAASAASGTHTIPIAAFGAITGVAHIANLILRITP